MYNLERLFSINPVIHIDRDYTEYYIIGLMEQNINQSQSILILNFEI